LSIEVAHFIEGALPPVSNSEAEETNATSLPGSSHPIIPNTVGKILK
jgi:hypothetical protein